MKQIPPERRDLPFGTYQKDEKVLRSCIWIGGNCRQGYGRKLIEVTRQSSCAYCGRSITADYYTWLTMAVDHVVPVSVCKRLKIEMEFCRSLANMVLCCAACNGFDNRYKLPLESKVTTFQEFLALRNEVFIVRKERIQTRHESERRFFEEKIRPLCA